MPISRGSIHHTLREDFHSLAQSFYDITACSRPSQEVRESTESFIANYFGVRYSLLLPYARTCFYAILKVLALPPNSEVLLTPFNISPMLHILYDLGLKPRFIDINLFDYGPKYESLEIELSTKPSCFLLTYLFGEIPNVELIANLCKHYQVPLIEDISQGIGGFYANKPLGTFGDVAFFSASLSKYVDGYNGAFILTSNSVLYRGLQGFAYSLNNPSKKRIRLIIFKTLIWNLLLNKLIFKVFTFYSLYLLRLLYRPTFDKLLGPTIKADFSKPLPDYYFEDIASIQAATILSHISKLRDLIVTRRDCASRLIDSIATSNMLILPVGSVRNQSCVKSSTFWQFIMFVGSTQEAQDSLFSAGIETGITNLPDLSSLCGIHLENAVILKTQYIFIPLHPYLKASDYCRIIKSLP